MSATKTNKKRRVPHRSKRLPKGQHGGIELLLVQPVEHLGEQGDVVEVKPGYANNYLLPQGLATVATEHHKRMVDKHRARLAEIQQERVASLKALAKDLSQQSLTIEANANDEGHLYGSAHQSTIVSHRDRPQSDSWLESDRQLQHRPGYRGALFGGRADAPAV